MFWVYNMHKKNLASCLLLLAFWPVLVWGFDPMAPPYAQEVTPEEKPEAPKKIIPVRPDYILRQIVVRSDQSKSAVINGYVLNVGGHLKGAVVKEIHADKVVLQVAGKEKILKLKPYVARVRK